MKTSSRPADQDTARQANAEGMAALRQGDAAAAIAAFTRATAADSAAGPLWRNLAHAHRLAGDPVGEEQALNQALSLDRTDFIAQLRLAQLLQRLGLETRALLAWAGAQQLAARLSWRQANPIALACARGWRTPRRR